MKVILMIWSKFITGKYLHVHLCCTQQIFLATLSLNHFCMVSLPLVTVTVAVGINADDLSLI